MSLFDLTDKVAIVTGSSRGIGRAIALRMAEQGARVVMASRKQEACVVRLAPSAMSSSVKCSTTTSCRITGSCN